MRKHAIQKKHDHCPYCEGKGYFQLLLGGSETCVECSGSGKKRA
ncbi:DnaJ-class molecular chaperone [Fictibacillus halophilus]|uniref:DnaJ-class molecular chaperone n=1 Tax=Fictibacillus halophilus TaxID=1610490 RepID=A0ABV2LG66_9BACL|nr:YuiA family protein [Fictibacillus halophilus]